VIPIVGLAADLVRTGLAASMARPGGNLTGGNILANEFDVKRLEILHEVVPAARRPYEARCCGAAGLGPGRSGRLGQPRAQQETDPLGRPLRGRDYGDDYTVKVPGEIDVQRARRIIEELRRRFGDVLRPQEELDYIERLLKDY
jgi:Domain of unknown function (DUF4175)